MRTLKRYRVRKVEGIDQLAKCASCLYLVPDSAWKTSTWKCRRTGKIHKCGWLSPNCGQTPHQYVCDGWKSWVPVPKIEDMFDEPVKAK